MESERPDSWWFVVENLYNTFRVRLTDKPIEVC